MSFLQPLLLAGLPLAALPVLIHLMNRRRHRTIRWGAMMFLLETQRRTQRMKRLRYLLIMAARILSIIGLIFAASRPLASGWWTSAFRGQTDTTILILDRSPSMEEQNVQTQQSKRSTGLRKLTDLFDKIGTGGRLVLIESTENRAQPIDAAKQLLDSPLTSPTAAAADVPQMLQTALDYISDNQAGRTDIWICSDLRDSDWKQEDGRWASLRTGFEQLPAVRFFLLSYPEVSKDNLSVWIERVRKRQTAEQSELVFDLTLRSAEPTASDKVPVNLIINGARTALDAQLSEGQFILQGHAIPLDDATESGWGRVELPADSNPQDNIAYFVFADAPDRVTTIVSDDPRVAEPLRIACAAPLDPSLRYVAKVIGSDQTDTLDWDASALVVWQAPLPTGIAAKQLENYVRSGRPILFLPPARVTGDALFGASWTGWQDRPREEAASIASWRGDADLLAHTQEGRSLQVGNTKIRRYCAVEGTGTVLARMTGGEPLLLRPDPNLPAYFLTTLPDPRHSSLAKDGIVFYILLQRALSLGVDTLGKARHLIAGTTAAHALPTSIVLQGDTPDLAATKPYQAAVHQGEEVLIAVNRPLTEDIAEPLKEEAIAEMFGPLDYRHVEDRVGSSSGLASELWRAFLLLMAFALMVEAFLCLPQREDELEQGRATAAMSVSSAA